MLDERIQYESEYSNAEMVKKANITNFLPVINQNYGMRFYRKHPKDDLNNILRTGFDRIIFLGDTTVSPEMISYKVE